MNTHKLNLQSTMRVLLATILLASTFRCAAQSSRPDIVLTGDIVASQNKHFVEVPFQVPAGIHRISVDFSFTGREQRTALDLGILDPERFRGESGGNKSHFTIAETDATPSYLPGAIPAGTWKLLISVPNIRKESISHYQAEIRFHEHDEEVGFVDQPLSTAKRWYRGDLHMHTGNSDGSCSSLNGHRVPCPVFLTVQTAASRGLDFIAITDHNTGSQYNAMRELQPYFDNILLIPGREMTTFNGHFNVYGITQSIPFDIDAGGRTLNEVLHTVKVMGGIASVNHAESPGGEDCMGCRWEPPADADMSLMSSVEVINGGSMFSSAKYWDEQLSKGNRLAAIGGSDNHYATIPTAEDGAIGRPTTVVEAKELSVPGIMAGIQAGRTIVDLTASRDKVVDFEATSGGAHARMGETLAVAESGTVQLSVITAGCTGLVLHLSLDGSESPSVPAMQITAASSTLTATLKPSPGRHWLHIEVRNAAGELQVLSSPLYINFPAEGSRR